MIGVVGDVECHQTQVGEVPEELWKEEEKEIHIEISKKSDC